MLLGLPRVPLVNVRQIRIARGWLWSSIDSRRGAIAEENPANGCVPGIPWRHNRERGSTKNMDGRDFIASYHGDTRNREMAGRRTREGREGNRATLAVVKVKDVVGQGAFAPFNRL